MSEFIALPVITRGAIVLWTMISFIILLRDLLIFMLYGARARTKVIVVVMTVLNGFLLHYLLLSHRRDGLPFTLNIKFVYLILIICVLNVSGVVLLFFHSKWIRENLSVRSVKEALDNLPTGLCFFHPGGMLKLVNMQMDSICLETTGMHLRNGEEFRQKLYSGEIGDTVMEAGEPILRLKNGKVFSFQLDEVELNGTMLHELIAKDITEEYELTAELDKQQKRAKEVNTRLRTLLNTIEYVTMSRELLEFKRTLHDNIGRSLLLAKRWLLSPDRVDRENMLGIWKSNIRYLINDEPEAWQTPYYVLEKQAGQLGIELVIDGKLPEEDALIKLVDTAIFTHMTNVIRHAEGTHAYVKVTEKQDCYHLLLRNDGKVPAEPVKERGGLSNLRREIEAAGGQMEISSDPVYVLHLILPKTQTQKTQEN